MEFRLHHIVVTYIKVYIHTTPSASGLGTSIRFVGCFVIVCGVVISLMSHPH